MLVATIDQKTQNLLQLSNRSYTTLEEMEYKKKEVRKQLRIPLNIWCPLIFSNLVLNVLIFLFSLYCFLFKLHGYIAISICSCRDMSKNFIVFCLWLNAAGANHVLTLIFVTSACMCIGLERSAVWCKPFCHPVNMTRGQSSNVRLPFDSS